MAMELGADGVLMNTAIAGAQDPVAMAEAMKLAVRAGRLAYLAGRIPEGVRDREQPARRGRRHVKHPVCRVPSCRVRVFVMKRLCSRRGDELIEREVQPLERHATLRARRAALEPFDVDELGDHDEVDTSLLDQRSQCLVIRRARDIPASARARSTDPPR